MESLPTMDDVIVKLLKQTLKEFKGRAEKTASSMNIGERTVYRMLKKYNIDASIYRANFGYKVSLKKRNKIRELSKTTYKHQIAKKFGISRQTVSEYLKHNH